MTLYRAHIALPRSSTGALTHGDWNSLRGWLIGRLKSQHLRASSTTLSGVRATTLRRSAAQEGGSTSTMPMRTSCRHCQVRPGHLLLPGLGVSNNSRGCIGMSFSLLQVAISPGGQDIAVLGKDSDEDSDYGCEDKPWGGGLQRRSEHWGIHCTTATTTFSRNG